MMMSVYRVFELDRSWAFGLFYPRLGMGLNFTYGAPLFQYYAPLASYGTLAFHWLDMGLVEATKAVFTLNLLCAGLGMYMYARWLFGNRRAAILAAVAYLFAPYLLCNIYERGAAAETLVLSLLPWAFWTTHRLLYDDDRFWLWGSAGLIALLVLSHNITALFALPHVDGVSGLACLATGSLAPSAARRIERLARPGVECLLLAAGPGRTQLCLDRGNNVDARLCPNPASIFAERTHSTLSGIRLLGTTSFPSGALGRITRRHSHRGHRVPDQKAEVSSRVHGWRGAHHSLSATRPVQTFLGNMPLVRFIQFPWRLLGPASFFLALLVGSLVCWKWLPRRAGWIGTITLMAIIISASVYNLSPANSTKPFSFFSSQVNQADLLERGRVGFSVFTDYMSKWVMEQFEEISFRVQKMQPFLPGWPLPQGCV